MKKRIQNTCHECNKIFETYPCRHWIKFCSKECRLTAYSKRVPWNKGLTGFRKGMCHHWYGRNMSGENNPRWRGGPKFWKKEDRRNDSGYIGWVKMVRKRDGNKCKINNKDCAGRIEVHHILNWKEYPELRYQINNGITLCHAHHPRGRAEEKRLIPTFQELVPVLSEKF